MSCCNKNEVKDKKRACPQCEHICWPAPMRTLLHHVPFPENQNILEGHYFFCAEQSCEVGYFSRDDMIAKNKLRVFQTPSQAMLCYCFDISVQAYQTALQQQSADGIKDFILEQTKEGLCACEVKNPSARCCWAKLQELDKLYAG